MFIKWDLPDIIKICLGGRSPPPPPLTWIGLIDFQLGNRPWRLVRFYGENAWVKLGYFGFAAQWAERLGHMILKYEQSTNSSIFFNKASLTFFKACPSGFHSCLLQKNLKNKCKTLNDQSPVLVLFHPLSWFGGCRHRAISETSTSQPWSCTTGPLQSHVCAYS